MPLPTIRAVPLLLLMLALAPLVGCDARQTAEQDASAADVPEADRYGGTLVIGARADIGDISPLTWNVQNALYMQQVRAVHAADRV